VVLADWAAAFYADVTPQRTRNGAARDRRRQARLATLADKLATCAWDKAAIAAALKEVLAAHGLKMPQLAMPVRVLVMGTAQTPSLDAVLELCFSREKVVARLKKAPENQSIIQGSEINEGL
jgi:glutamyl-tRNA synthetase